MRRSLVLLVLLICAALFWWSFEVEAPPELVREGLESTPRSSDQEMSPEDRARARKDL